MIYKLFLDYSRIIGIFVQEEVPETTLFHKCFIPPVFLKLTNDNQDEILAI